MSFYAHFAKGSWLTWPRPLAKKERKAEKKGANKHPNECTRSWANTSNKTTNSFPSWYPSPSMNEAFKSLLDYWSGWQAHTLLVLLYHSWLLLLTSRFPGTFPIWVRISVPFPRNSSQRFCGYGRSALYLINARNNPVVKRDETDRVSFRHSLDLSQRIWGYGCMSCLGPTSFVSPQLGFPVTPRAKEMATNWNMLSTIM